MSAYRLNQDQSRAISAKQKERGFTLIELSIVLVIIGLIVGGVLVGQDLIRAAEVRATISQIEKYNTAVNTFRGKYNALPGDMNVSTATAFGFTTTGRGATAGTGDGNGVIEGYSSSANGFIQGGETTAFWVDLSVGNATTPLNINLIDGSFSTAAVGTGAASIVSTAIASWYPPAKLGRGNSVYVYSTNGINYYGIANIASVASGVPNMTSSMTVNQAYQIDKKVDDGFPITGNVTATLGNATTENAAANITSAGVSDTATTCYNTSNSTTGAYSNSINNGAGANCSLSFRFQ